ncbi:hypothetical protein [Xanthocytophaga agilis]|uniref:Uncharacterized protein n=1 Tax=Xanthocytophaga agilis TaxID=3048010 RepID=A0AAE3R5H5_9BACT|nr:hypothetical protein [Xanthocytophaga agilis]MDJ1501745.1 hypothetical protein [Xanthocytophaga agilis]
MAGKGIVNGTWKTIEDTLIMNINFPKKEKLIIKQENSNSFTKKQIILKTTEKDSIPISNAKVIINDTIMTQSNYDGAIYGAHLLGR